MADITMPQLGETVTEGTITRWTKAVGDQVAEDEVLYEVSTDKVDSEVPSPSSGYVSEILVPEGETVPVGTVLARISDQAPGGGNGAAPAEPEAEAERPEADASESGASETGASETGASETGASETGASESEAAGEPAGTGAVDEPAEEGPSPDGAKGAGGGTAALLSPVVRRLIAEHDLDPAQIRGTGVGGRITRNDVQKAVAGGAGARRPAEAPPGPENEAEAATSTPPRPAPAKPPKPGERDEVIPFSRIRRATAEHMVRSKAISAHTLIAVEVDYSSVEKVRRAEKDAFRAEEGVGLTYLAFIARAVVDAIDEFPHVNSSVGDDELVVHRYVDLGIAVDLDFQGLLVPVIRDAHDKRLRAIARQIGDLAAKARSKRLSPDDLVGGTFTLTNAGPFGTFLTIPVISQPQTAILSTDGVKKKPVAVVLPDGGDGIAVHPVGILALTFDHRAFDGAYAAAFVARVKEILETRDWSVEL
ncbi:MAG: dihydrolipoamide acetyltransferase family protein [Acidimicrobiales bacterium]